MNRRIFTMQDKFYYRGGTIFEGEFYNAPHYKDSSKILHREDGPAMEWASGTKEWYLNGELHREDGPAREYSNGAKEWWQNGNLHREDGPAIEYSNGYKEWWLNGKRLKTLSKEYLIRYMELTGECLASLLLSPDKVLRESTKKYEWKEFDNESL